MARPDTPLLAVLIDADNSSASWAEAVFKEIASLGEASVRRIYGDFTNPHLKAWQSKLASLALVPHHQPANTTGKNSSDIALVIDAMDILHSGRFDGFVLVSSDSDFTRLASRIREQGLDVFGIGQRKTPDAFRMACKRFIYVENLIEPIGDTAPPGGAVRASTKAGPVDAMSLDETEKEPAQRAVPLILAAMRAIDPEGDWFHLGQLGQFILRANPDFDSRAYGKGKLRDLLQSIPRFEVKQGDGNVWRVRDRA
ncbi:MAG: NYN domain-containing protein [Paracoccaceae bacterium]